MLLSAGTVPFTQTQKTRIMFRKVSTLGTHYSVCYNYKERENCFTTEVLAIRIYNCS